MLAGAEAARCILLDTDSRSGDPSEATRWCLAPIEDAARQDASLHGLLRLPPIGMPPDVAASFHGHSAKRFLLNVAEASPYVTEPEAQELGRFSQSTAQQADLEPTAAMLRAHALRAAVLPAIYAQKTKVARAFDLLAKVHLVMEDAVRRVRTSGASLPVVDGWGADGPFACETPGLLALVQPPCAPLPAAPPVLRLSE